MVAIDTPAATSVGTDADTQAADTQAVALDAECADLLAELEHARHFLVFPTRDLTDEQAGSRPTVSAWLDQARGLHGGRMDALRARGLRGDAGLGAPPTARPSPT